jgi:hypothetical protein
MALSRLELHTAAVRQHHHRIAALVGEIIQSESGAPLPSIFGLIGVAGCMARYLPVSSRAAVADRMQSEAKALLGISMH